MEPQSSIWLGFSLIGRRYLRYTELYWQTEPIVILSLLKPDLHRGFRRAPIECLCICTVTERLDLRFFKDVTDPICFWLGLRTFCLHMHFYIIAINRLLLPFIRVISSPASIHRHLYLTSSSYPNQLQRCCPQKSLVQAK